MQTRFFHWLIGATILGTAGLETGCLGEKVGDTRMESASVELQGASRVRVELKIGVGELRLSGGAKKLLEGEFIYNIPSWKPEVKYEVNGQEGKLVVRQPSVSGPTAGKAKNEWNLTLNDKVPIDLSVEAGVGQGNFELGTLLLERLDVQTGVGETTLDLVGDWKKDLHANVKGGVGQVTLRLPGNVGVRVESQKGIGSVQARGLKKENNIYVNEAYGKSTVTLNFHIEAGIGEIRLELVD
jgi:hypothetical protein